MKNILLISTGGTFNKVYNPLNGNLEVDAKAKALDEINTKWQSNFEVVSIIGKDSLEITDSDRLLLLATINLSKHNEIIIIHGTDTMELTATYLADAKLQKSIVLTGAMVPYSIDPVEASVNLGAAYGYLQATKEPGISIAMNGIILPHDRLTKDREAGRFVVCKEKLTPELSLKV